MRGGYKIADFKNQVLTSGESVSMPGMFEAVSSPYKKPVMVEGLKIGETAYAGFYAVFLADNDNLTAQAAIGANTVTITVTPEDAVTVTVAASRMASANKSTK